MKYPLASDTWNEEEIEAINEVDIPKGYLISTPCIGSYSAIFLTGCGGGVVSLPIVEIISRLFNSSIEKPIGNSCDKRVDNTKLYIYDTPIYPYPPISISYDLKKHEVELRDSDKEQ